MTQHKNNKNKYGSINQIGNKIFELNNKQYEQVNNTLNKPIDSYNYGLDHELSHKLSCQINPKYQQYSSIFDYKILSPNKSLMDKIRNFFISNKYTANHDKKITSQHGHNHSIIGPDCKIYGDIDKDSNQETSKTMELFGHVNGKNFLLDHLLIGKTAKVNANVEANQSCTINGSVIGNIKSNNVEITNTAKITGSIKYKHIGVEPLATFSGQLIRFNNMPTTEEENNNTIFLEENTNAKKQIYYYYFSKNKFKDRLLRIHYFFIRMISRLFIKNHNI